MNLEELRNLFCMKISMEQEAFKQEMLKQSPEEIYGNAYEIDCIINIYELLLEMSRKFEEKALKSLLVFPSLLAFLYESWLAQEDSFVTELESYLERATGKIQRQSKEREEQGRGGVTA